MNRQPDPERARARFIDPMLCLAVDELPEGPGWTYEVKLDGYRAIGCKSSGRATLFSRNGRNFDLRFPTVARAMQSLPDESVIDGEVVAVDDHGRPTFGGLQNHRSGGTILFYAFDLPMLAGRDLQRETLGERRRMLGDEVIPRLDHPLRLSENFEVSAAEMIELARGNGLEGVVAKRLDSPYEAGKRSGAWVKFRVNQSQNLVIGGFVPAGTTFDSILVGYYRGRDLMYAARVRNGFTPHSRAVVLANFRGLETPRCPFKNLPETKKGRWGEGLTAEDMTKCRWLKPQLVATIEFVEWTEGDHLRHCKFADLTTTADPRKITRAAN